MRRPVVRASAAPPMPTAPHAAISHGVQGPCPKKKFDVSAATAPITNPGAPPNA